MRRLAGALPWALSALLHGGLLALLAGARPPEQPTGEIVVLEIAEPPPPPRIVSEPPRPPAPSRAALVPVRPEAPPPPNQPSPAPAPVPGAELPPRARIRIGVSLSATATGGGFAAPVGNTLYGKPPETAPDPAEVKPLQADRYAPPTEVDSPPVRLQSEVPLSAYPAEARAAGLEGEVRLRLLIDADGRVREATALNDPGKGLAAGAVAIARQYYRFRPARRGGEPVATEFVMQVQFVLP